MSRQIDYIVVHTTATPQDATVGGILKYWKSIGWTKPGYHRLYPLEGNALQLLPYEEVSNGVRGWNPVCIHLSYMGGIDGQGKPTDTRTRAQTLNLIEDLIHLKNVYPEACIQGHRDFPGVRKACPSFDVRDWLADLDKAGITGLL